VEKTQARKADDKWSVPVWRISNVELIISMRHN